MDNMNRRTNTNYQNNLRNSISEYISNNLDQVTRNNQNQRNTRTRLNSISQSNNISNNQLITNIVDSLNRNMLIYHVNISEYLSSVSTILNLIDNENNTLEEINNTNVQNQETNTQNQETNTEIEQTAETQTRNEETNNNNQTNGLQPRTTYYYRSNPVRSNIPAQYVDPINNERSDIWRRWAIRTPISSDNINSPYRNLGRNFRQPPPGLLPPQGTTNRVTQPDIQQRSPFNIYNFLSRNNDPFSNNELMQEYFQNLFQNVIVSPTSEQIDNATEVFTYTEGLQLLNHRCPITLEDFQENDNIRRIRYCGHCFNEESIQHWFRNNVRCPVCRLDIRDVSENVIERENTNVNNRNDEDTDEDLIDEDTLNHGVMNNNEDIPSPRPLRPTLSDISVSTSSTINDTQMDSFLSSFANNIRDNLTDNLENIMQPIDGNISSHIQIDIPFEHFNYESLYDLSDNIFENHDYP